VVKTSSVSAILPTFNNRKVIARAIDSLLGQTRPVDEIIVIDDCSTDGTADFVLAEYGDKIKLIRAEQNGGPARARNLGLSQARGDYIGIIDGDDAWTPDRNERFLRLAEESGPDIIGDNLLLYDGGAGQVVGAGFEDDQSLKEITTEGLFLGDVVTRPGFNYAAIHPYLNRIFMAKHGLRYDEAHRYGEDFKLYAEIMFCGGRCVLTSVPGYIYTGRFGSISGQVNEQSASDARFDMLHKISQELREAYADRITPEISRAMTIREKALWLTHEANVARAFRRSGNLLRYAGYVLARPGLIKLLIERQVRRRLKF
jgi:succinoglycan biosynthesis protein ExoO